MLGRVLDCGRRGRDAALNVRRVARVVIDIDLKFASSAILLVLEADKRMGGKR